MKTILYNPIFINPQAYYVFPRLTRYLQPDNESTAEPANYIGTIEVKVIAYGDTTLKRTYTNTDSIDLSEFKNTWMRISLFTKVGSCVLGEWKIGNMESDLPYIDPEVLASLKAVVIVGNKTNNDSDRAIVKNLVDPDNPFVISNAAYTEGSGYADKGSPYYGAFVTDGVEDLITSTKTVQEMGITDEVTVVSMIHQIDLNSTYTIATTNYIENSNSREHVRSDVYNYGKTGIYGYSASLINNTKSDIKNILGDEADYYVKSTNSLQTIFDAKFSVVGRISELTEASQVAWYWTIIANKVLTTDQINQVIAYFNLDRTLKPDILCDVKKQGITNENHAEFGDKLIDFSGNGRDIQLNNIAWKGDSGIGKYEVDFASLNYNNTTSVFTATYKSCSISKIIKDGVGNIFYNWGQTLAAINSTKIQVIGLDEIGAILEFTYLDESGNSTTKQYSTDGIYDLPASAAYQGDSHNTNFRFSIRGYIGDCDITMTQIPSHAGALLLDGINDFGKVTGMPVYKDYTVIADYIRISAKENAQDSPILSKSKVAGSGAFLFNYLNADSVTSSFSFGTHNALKEINDFERKIYYLSKYASDGYNVNAGYAVDYDTMWLGAYRDNAQNFFNGAIYSLMSFPYSMSEFLIERQLKKYKLGTLYPDMVEFRPIVKSNNKWNTIEIWQGDKSLYRPTVNDDKTGIYLKKDSTIGIYVKPKDADEVTKIVVNGTEYTNLKINSNGFYYVTLPITKSPQKINITIDEYIRFEDIVQPYPVLLRFNDENGNEVSWGGKFRVGSTITRIGSIADPESNLLNGLYSISGLSLNGKAVTSSTSIVEKQMVFKTTATYLLDNNEPKCILSPSRLRIPNSSYKLLGYIPDISGHGNHGVIHNSAYEGASGANGYLQNFSEWTKASGVSSTDSVISSSNNLVAANGWIAYVTSGTVIPTFKVEISGIPVNGNLRFEDSDQTLVNGVNTIQGITTTKVTGFYISSGYDNDWSNLKIEQIGEYEGAYCFDGVDDFVTIPTTVGGKQVLMKVNWQKSPTLLYDQRASGSFAVLTTLEDDAVNPRIAYQARNQDGKTYIDGIENNYIETYTLKDITHNITIANSSSGGVIVPVIGCNTGKTSSFAKMSLYDFMLFDEISTDDKILELNEYVGIEGNTE